MLAGATGTAMAGLPAGADTWKKTLLFAGLNPFVGAASTQAQKSLLQATGNEKAAEAYDPFDMVSRGIDSVLGLAFGAMGKYNLNRKKMSTATKDSIDTVANYQKMVKDTPIADNADLAHKAMSKAVADIANGKPVDLAEVLPDNVKLKTPATPVRAEEAEAKANVAQAMEDGGHISPEEISYRIESLYGRTVSKVSNALDKIIIGAVSDENAQSVKDATGIEISGLKRTIDNYAIKHILKNHGDAKKEEARGNIAVTKEDILKIPSIVSSPDAVITAGKTQIGRDAVVYKKRVNGTTYYIEEIRTGKDELSTTTMYKKKSGTSTAENTSSYTPEALPAPLDPNIPQSQGNVNVEQSVSVSPEPNAAPAKPATLKTILPIDKSMVESFRQLHADISSGEAGYRMQPDHFDMKARGEVSGMKWEGVPSTFPEYFKNKGYKKKETLEWIRRVIEGEPVTEKQKSVVIDLADGFYREKEADLQRAMHEMESYGDMWQDGTVASVESDLSRNGDLPIGTGKGIDGTPSGISSRKYIDDTKAELKKMESHRSMLDRMADCAG